MKVSDLVKSLNKLPTYVIELGVFVGKTNRKSSQQGQQKRYKIAKKTKLSGVTNAELLYIHEHGTRTIPKRPVIQLTFEHARQETIPLLKQKIIKEYLATQDIQHVDLLVDQFCQRTRDYAKQIIYSNDGRLTKNAPSTIKAKGFDHPLFQTGQLVNSIDCRYIKMEK